MPKIRDSSPRDGFLNGQMIVAMPGMTDERFSRSVIYLCAHSQDGAMGIVINHPARKVTFSEILVQLDVLGGPLVAGGSVDDVPVVRGGPVEAGRGFVLHTADYFVDNSTLPIDYDVSLTATLDVLRAIAQGHGPRKAVLALGYAGWSPGQLEAEIQDNGWLHCPADASLLFDPALDAKYGLALRRIGIDPVMLSGQAGHA
ncbi:YqgE/AlgH family protein [Lichenihabitans sp. Uapishka_5]|uniref:YqgE/AlgH family protein n=1 Tax=Lichenihabitans sp. Uapishka_5 TaxID=3037302 RepID=UPI0029E80366|nr:YqgE/AlgH family protein [Lichenihabitans sp. Uapishka_5]MDX7952089.1 YqgE/AlgH family protein [Lichenihabitans sp. Uapishka_5]